MEIILLAVGIILAIWLYRRATSASPPAALAAMPDAIRPAAANLATGKKGLGVYEIEYADADGVVTSRNITVMQVEALSHAIYIRAWCHTRRSDRTFRADRVLRLRGVPDGRVYDDASVHFYDFVPEHDRPDPDHESVMARVKPGLGCLVWIAMADREISSDESEVLLSFIHERNGLAGAKYAGVPWSRAKAAIYIDSARPTFATAIAAVSKLSRTSKELALLDRFARQLADIGGTAAEHRRQQVFKN